MKTEYVYDKELGLILELLTYPNRLACSVCLETGLRIGDVLALRSESLKQRFTVTESKTGKKRRVYISKELLQALRGISGDVYVFEHRTDPTKHRSRQAVYLDIKRAAKAFRLSANISTHSLRKHYAVEIFNRYGLEAVKNSLNHDNELTTMLYAYSALLRDKPRYGGADRAHR